MNDKSATKTLYTPILYATPQSTTRFARVPEAYLDYLSRKHVALAQIVQEVPPSRCGSPVDEDGMSKSIARAEALRMQVRDAYDLATGDPADGKWGLIVQLLRMGSTRGRTRWVGSTVEGRAPAYSGGWVNARTEGEWFEWEKKWKEEHELKSKVESWKQTMDIHTSPESGIVGSSVQSISDNLAGIKTGVAYEKVKGSFSPATHSSQLRPRGKLNTKNSNGHDPRDPTPLGFVTVKRSSLTITGKPRPSGKGLPADDVSASPSKLKAEYIRPGNDADVPPRVSAPAGAINIADISETPFLPPSFSSHLVTSTPNDRPAKRRKPSPIPITTSSPANARAYGRPQINLDATSSLLDLSTTPTRQAKQRLAARIGNRDKRPRSASPGRVVKKARTSSSVPTSSNLPPPSTPSPQPEVPMKSFGSTSKVIPQRNPQLPTLTELLASSRNIKGSLKGKSRRAGDAHAKVVIPKDSPPRDLPVEDPSPHSLGIGMELGPDTASPTKSLSSLAYSDSEGSDEVCGPDFTHESGFSPPFASTQMQFGSPRDGMLMSHTGSIDKGSGLVRTDSALSWMGYNSQFDVNGQVEQVSKFMEKDVDYEGWLRDPSLEQEDVSR